jgi:hypothetical protein
MFTPHEERMADEKVAAALVAQEEFKRVLLESQTSLDELLLDPKAAENREKERELSDICNKLFLSQTTLQEVN